MMRLNSARGAACLLTTLAITGCAVGPDYQRPELALQDEFAASLASSTAETALESAWWESLGDPVLDEVVRQAAHGSFTIAEAEARLREASARRGAATAALLPSLATTLGSQRFKLSGNGANPVAPLARAGIASLTGEATQLGVQSSWEVDLFGRSRRGREAAIASEAGAEANLRDVTLSVVASAATAYIELRGVQRQRALAERSVEIESGEARLYQARFEFGLVSEFERHAAQSRQSVAAASVPMLFAAERELLAGLGVLLGVDIDRAIEIVGATQTHEQTHEQAHEQMSWTLAASVPTGLPSELIARRSDVRRAEQALIAANAQLGAAQAARYPSFALTGNAGQEAVDFADIFESMSRNWAFAPLIRFPVFTGGAIRAETQAAEARREAAEAQFQRAVLVALSEVEIQLSRYGQSQLRRRELAAAEQSALAALGAAEVLYEQGLVDELPVFIARRAHLARTLELIASETETAQALVGLYRALGGGWEAL